MTGRKLLTFALLAIPALQQQPPTRRLEPAEGERSEPFTRVTSLRDVVFLVRTDADALEWLGRYSLR